MVPLGHAMAVVSILAVLLAGPLMLGSFVVMQRSGLVVALLWVGMIGSLLLVTFVAGTLGYFLLPV